MSTLSLNYLAAIVEYGSNREIFELLDFES